MKLFQIFRIIIIFFLFSGNVSAQPPRQNVILVIIDGARYSETLGDPSAIYIPRMKQLANEGAVVSNFLNDSITITKYAIPAIWCGSWSTPKDTTINGNATQYATAPSVWEYYRKNIGADSLDALYLLKSLTAPWLPSYYPSYGPSYWPAYILQGWNDTQVWQNARAKLQTHHPHLTVLYLADVDGAGHSGDWLKYTKAIFTADSIVGTLWDFIQTDTIYKNCTDIIVTNDHGRHSDGVSTGFVSHGDGCAGCRHIIFLGAGPGFKRSYSSTITRKIPDIIPTIGSLLHFPASIASGSKMTELLSPIYFRTPEIIDFGEMQVESSATANILIYNSGGVPLTIGSVENELNDIDITPLSLLIAPHDSGFFEARYSPSSPNVLDGIIVLHHDGEQQHDTVHLLGSVQSGDVTRTIEIQAKWNLMSLPVQVANSRIDFLFPSAISSAFEYDGNYVSADSLLSGKGYWLKFPANESINITGTPIINDSIAVIEGWNLVGGISYPISVDSILTDPPDIISGKFFGYSAGYSVSDTLQPGSGYWVKINNPGILILK
jgi:hypothetical protein